MLSLSKILNEISERAGPRTGGLELDREKIWNVSKVIANRIKNRSGKNKYIIQINNPITRKIESVPIVLEKVDKDNIEGRFEGGIIYLFIKGKKFRRLPINQLTDFIFRTLIHELVHRFDPSDYRSYKDANDAKYEDYFNQPQEIRSYLQQVIDDVQRRIIVLKSKNDSKERIENFKKNPISLLDISPSWQEIKEHISPENIKRFYMAAFRLSEII